MSWHKKRPILVKHMYERHKRWGTIAYFGSVYIFSCPLCGNQQRKLVRTFSMSNAPSLKDPITCSVCGVLYSPQLPTLESDLPKKYLSPEEC